jgi:hypothetical protein
MKTKEQLSQECVNVHLQALKGAEVFNAKQNLVTPNDKFKVTYGSKEWENVLSRAKSFGYTEIKVLSVVDKTGKDKVEDNGLIQKEVNEAMTSEEKQLTPEQKEIAELKARLEAMESNGSKKDDVIDTELLEKLRKQYSDLFDKKPHHLLGVEKLQEAINEKLNEK